MSDRPFLQLLQSIQQRAQAQGREAPIATRLIGMLGAGSPAQPQTPPPAVQQAQQPQPAPAAPQASAMASYAPMQRPGGPTPSPLASSPPMQRPERPNPLAQPPMQRPGGSAGVPLPTPNPDRILPQAFGAAPVGEVMAGGPMTPAQMQPPAALQSPQALAAYTAQNNQPQTGMATPEAPRYEGGPNLYGYQGQGGIPRVEYGLGDMSGSMGAMGKIDPAIIQALMSGGQQSQGIDPNVLQQVIMQLQQRGAGV